MIRYLSLLFLLTSFFAHGQQKISEMTSATTLSGAELVPIVQTTNKKATVSLLRGFGSYGTAGQYLTVNGTTNGITFVTPPFISAYPGAGIAVSTGSAWGTSITDNSANWNTAYGWGDHAGLYLLKNDITYLSALTGLNYSNANFSIEGSSDNNVKMSYSDQFTLRVGTQAAGSYGTGILLLDNTNLRHFYVGTNGLRINVGSDATGDTYYRNSSGYLTRLPAGTNGHVLTLSGGLPSWAAPSGGGGTWGSITGTLSSQTDLQNALDAKLNLTGATYTTTTGDGLALTTSTLTSGNLVSLTSTSTAAASNTNTLLNISSSGSNATSTQTVTGAKISVTNTGTSATNDALTVSSSGGTTNNAIKVSGGNILLTQAASQSILKSGGVLTFGVSDFNTLALAVQNTNRITINGSSGAFTFTTNAVSSGAIIPYSFNDFARTNQTASTETNFVNWTPNTTQYATGAQTILRTYRMNPAAYSFVGASTITDAYTLWVDDPVASTNATITNNWAAGFQGNVQITGNLGNTSSRVTKGWFTDLEVTNPIPGTIGGSTGLTDNAIPRANGTGGSTLQSSGVTIDDYDVITASGFKQGSFSSGGTIYQTQQASLGSYGASSTGFIGLSNSSDYANNTVLYVEFIAVLMKSDGTASVSATVQSRFRKNNSGTWVVDSAGTAVTSDATVMTTLVGDINGGVPGVTWTSGAFAGTYAGGFSSKITAYIY